jgi:hypothetical protein
MDVIKFVLKQRAGSTTTAPNYKLKVTRFFEGTVVEWIDFEKPFWSFGDRTA